MNTSSSRVAGAAALVIASIVGCAGRSNHVYAPDTANTTAAGLPAARTPVPPERPQGAIEVVSYGLTQLNQTGMKIPVLHVRAIVTNDGDDQPWTLDTTEQMVEIPGEGRSRAIYVNADVGTLPKVAIARHERRVLDFYFPLPETVGGDGQLRQFELLWEVDTPSRTVASRTSFDRVERAPSIEYQVGPARWPVWAGFGPYWWYDPFYPRAVFIHHRPIIIRQRGHVTVDRFDGRFQPRNRPPVVTRRSR